jgi:3-keto-5-aminohexanoate cleavage enzyme
MTEDLVIAVSINGEKSKETNPNVPRSHAEIVSTALACYEAGASILHAHNKDTSLIGVEAAEDYLIAWREVRRLRPGALWYPTVTRAGGDELSHVAIIDDAIGLEFACVDPGAVAVARYDDEGLPTGRYYMNGFEQIRSAFQQLEQRGLGPQIAIYEPAYLRIVLAYHRAGRLPKGAVVNFYFGGPYGLLGPGSMPFGLPPTPMALEAYLDLLGDTGLPWTVSVWGGDLLQTELPEMAIRRGGHIQIGLESHFDPVAKPSNEEQVEQVMRLASRLGRQVAGRDATLAAWNAPRRSRG